MQASIKRILVITLSNTGDVVLTTPVIEAVLKRFKGAKVDIIAGPNGREIFEKDKRLSKIFLYDKHSGLFEKYRLIKKLRNMHYDMAIDLKNTAIPFLIGAPIKSGFKRRKALIMHKKDEHLSVIKDMGIDVEGARLNIELAGEDYYAANALLKNIKNKFIVVSCGGRSHTKRWPASYFAALSDIIKEKLNYDIVLVGKTMGNSPDADSFVAEKVKKIMQAKPLDLVGKTNVRELACIIKKAEALVTNDSAPLHIASAVNTPTLVIFGPTDERKYGPLADKSIVLRKKLFCAPCEKPQCAYNYECTRQITVDDAVSALKQLLKTTVQ